MNLNTIPPWHMRRCWDYELLQQWWLTRWFDKEEGACSNIRIGDFFTLGRNNQVGVVYGKVIMCYPKDSPDIPGDGPHFQYDIGGDIGGHWYRPMHENMEKGPLGGGEQYFLFVPSATQLAEISTQLADVKLLDWAQELLVYYRDHPGEITHQGYLNIKARKERERARSTT